MPCSWSFPLQQASMATRNGPCAPLLRASQQRLRAVLQAAVSGARCVIEPDCILFGVNCASAVFEK
eukprot:166839-Pelagomonas_calceolata.AAC.1